MKAKLFRWSHVFDCLDSLITVNRDEDVAY